MIISYIIGIGMCFIVATIVSIFWVRGITYMHENYPNYKGNDLFGEFDEDNLLSKTERNDKSHNQS